jgi:hypothetical protein
MQAPARTHSSTRMPGSQQLLSASGPPTRCRALGILVNRVQCLQTPSLPELQRRKRGACCVHTSAQPRPRNGTGPQRMPGSRKPLLLYAAHTRPVPSSDQCLAATRRRATHSSQRPPGPRSAAGNAGRAPALCQPHPSGKEVDVPLLACLQSWFVQWGGVTMLLH